MIWTLRSCHIEAEGYNRGTTDDMTIEIPGNVEKLSQTKRSLCGMNEFVSTVIQIARLSCGALCTVHAIQWHPCTLSFDCNIVVRSTSSTFVAGSQNHCLIMTRRVLQDRLGSIENREQPVLLRPRRSCVPPIPLSKTPSRLHTTIQFI